MLTVTQNAKQLLKEILVTHSDDPEMGMRLVVLPQDGHFALLVAEEQAGDQLVEHEGLKVLMVAPDLATAVDKMTLDIENTDSGPNLIINK